jgi:hypothetical protein
LKYGSPLSRLYDETGTVKRAWLIPAILMLFTFAGLPVSAQQQSPTVCLVYTIQDLSPAGTDSGDYEQTITDAVSAAAAAQGYTLVAANSWQDAAAGQSLDPAHIIAEAPALAVARAVGADIAVSGSYVVAGDQIYYSLLCWDVGAGKLAAGIQQTTPLNLAFFTQLNESITNTLFPSVHLERVETPRLVFSSADEGMEVILAGDVDIGRITNGHVSWPVSGIAAGTKIVVEKRKPGFHTDRQTVALVTGKEIPLTPLAPEHASAIELSETLGQLLGAGAAVRAYAIPDWLFLYAGAYLWMQPPATLSFRAAFHDDTQFGLGGYLLFPPASLVRMGIASGAGAVLTFLSTPGFPVYTDVYIDLARIWLELDLPRFAFLLRADVEYGLGWGTNLLGQGWLLNSGPVITVGVIFR